MSPPILTASRIIRYGQSHGPAKRMLLRGIQTYHTIETRRGYKASLGEKAGNDLTLSSWKPPTLSRHNSTQMRFLSSSRLRASASAENKPPIPATDEEEYFDVVIVGAGIAGLSAALEASLQSPDIRILLLDRFRGGGTSFKSGGVVYAGGGTKQQIEAGYGSDTPENMELYLRREVGLEEGEGVVGEEAVRKFCKESKGMIDWLEKEGGCKFAGNLCDWKTSYPPDGYTLYFSGNEKAHPYNSSATPAPRGHKHVGNGMTGNPLISNLFSRVLGKPNITFRPFSQIEGLDYLEGEENAPRELEISLRHLPQSPSRLHGAWQSLAAACIYSPPLTRLFGGWERKAFERAAKPHKIHSKAVVLSMGGFIYNPTLSSKKSPSRALEPHGKPFIDAGITQLGTLGDDGRGILLGLEIGGQAKCLDRMTAWRFVAPPISFMRGLTVGTSGERIANEDLYGATWSQACVEKSGGKAWLVLDEEAWKAAKQELKDGKTCNTIQSRIAKMFFLPWGHIKANDLQGIAKKAGINKDGLLQMVHEYNASLADGKGDPAGKAPEFCQPFTKGPFYAINLEFKSTFNPTMGLSLGGLVVDDNSGTLVKAGDTEDFVHGVYAAGRTAVGICSNSYVSGLSLADGVFSGRRAGAHAVKYVSGNSGKN